jgi:hypothetical protein
MRIARPDAPCRRPPRGRGRVDDDLVILGTRHRSRRAAGSPSASTREGFALHRRIDTVHPLTSTRMRHGRRKKCTMQHSICGAGDGQAGVAAFFFACGTRALGATRVSVRRPRGRDRRCRGRAASGRRPAPAGVAVQAEGGDFRSLRCVRACDCRRIGRPGGRGRLPPHTTMAFFVAIADARATGSASRSRTPTAEAPHGATRRSRPRPDGRRSFLYAVNAACR